MRPIHKKIFLLFALYLLFSVAVVAFDRHGPLPDRTCLICTMGSFLSSAVGESTFSPETLLTITLSYLPERACTSIFLAGTSGISLRGPPLPEACI